MDYLRCFAITFGVFDTAGVIVLIFGVLLILCWLAALFLENSIFLTAGLLFSALYFFMQILFYELPRKVKMSTIAHTLPAIFMFFPGGTSHCQANEVIKMSPGIDSRFVFPLTLSEEPLNRLLVASFKDNPEYEGIEPQMFDDNITGKGLKILMYRKDKKVDVYWQPGVHFDINTFKIGEGIGHAAETVISPSRFDISENGVDINIAFKDKSGRNVKILIKENTQNIHPFPFLAPVGNDVNDPNKLFAVYMKEFDFVRREGTAVHVTIGDRKLTPANFPITRDRQKVYLMRYASSLVIGEINASVTKPYVVESKANGIVETGDMSLQFNVNNEVQRCWVDSKSDRIELKFGSGFPNLLTLPQNKKFKGSWQYAVTGEVLFGGTYSLLRDNSKVYVEFDVTEKWEPQNIPFSFKIFTGIVRSFRTWPATYIWNATIDLNEMSAESKWLRK